MKYTAYFCYWESTNLKNIPTITIHKDKNEMKKFIKTAIMKYMDENYYTPMYNIELNILNKNGIEFMNDKNTAFVYHYSADEFIQSNELNIVGKSKMLDFVLFDKF